MMNTIIQPLDLSAFPIPDVVEAFSFEEIKAAMVVDLQARDPGISALLESDPAMKLLEAGAYREMVIRQRVNDAARQTYLASATGDRLDAMGSLFRVDRLTGEDDTRFRARVQLGLVGLGAAGPRRAYQAHTLSVSPAIIDAGVVQGAPGEIVVTVLGWVERETEGLDAAALRIGRALFDQPVDPGRAVVLMPGGAVAMDAVRARLAEEDVLPLTDSAIVIAPQVLEFEVAASLIIYPGPDAATVLSRARASLASYLRTLRLVGYDATRAGITAALMVPGVQNVLLVSPGADVVASPRQMVAATSIAITAEAARVA